MITYEMIIDAQTRLVQDWGKQGKRVIETCAKEKPFGNSSTEFLNYCTACGGNWAGMLLSGIKALYENVWNVIPDHMGKNAFANLCCVLNLLGVDTSE